MKLVECNINELESITYSKSKNQELLEEFINSGIDCVRIEDFPQKDAKSCVNSFNASIKRYRYHGVKAITRCENVYLIKI